MTYNLVTIDGNTNLEDDNHQLVEVKVFFTMEESQERAKRIARNWERDGFERTRSGTYAKKSYWRIVFVIDSFGEEWRPEPVVEV